MEAGDAALILAENVERRNLSAGQRAMARAMLEPEGKAGRPKTGEKSPTELGFSGEIVRMARYVLRHDEALAQSVMSGAVTLSAAYYTAKAGADAKERAAGQSRFTEA
ncbi:hypothetical protein [Sinorhizobium meliloti]|uniref:hypothetical protein n=1 Tax=Rhizobium meliloti TaxID=382 RepID=UPI00299F0DCC|nr:hypothetical protein [Sinorhizobium meliloti]